MTTRAIADSKTDLFLYGGSKKILGKDLSGRPYYDLAMFWNGDVWTAVEADPRSVHKLKPAEASQRGRLYPPF